MRVSVILARMMIGACEPIIGLGTRAIPSVQKNPHGT